MEPTPAPSTLSRRRLTALVPGLALAPVLADAAPAAASPTVPDRRVPTHDADVAALEAEHATTIGLVARNLRTGTGLGHRPHDRQPVCSTFKPLAAAVLLRRPADLDRVVRYRERDLVDYSPVTAERRAMTLGQLCDAAIRFSDNTAGNLVLRAVGGPRGLTRALRRLGDDVTRLDRWETELNSAVPGDPRDTSTPAALATTYARLLDGRLLRDRERWVLRGWLQSSTTSVERFRSGLPPTWWCADKTGSGSYGVMNDVGLVTAPDGTEIVFAALTRASTEDPDATGSPTLMADLAGLVVDRLR